MSESTMIVGKSGPSVINLDAVQCGVTKDKSRLGFFAKAAKIVRGENAITPAPIKVYQNNVTIRNGEVNRFVVNRDKKAKTISTSKDKSLVERVMKAIDRKYRAKESTPNR